MTKVQLFILKTKNEEVLISIIISKGTLHFQYVFPKQTKTNEKGLDKRRKSFKLCNRNEICFLIPCLFIFHQVKLLSMHKKCVCFVIIF